MKIILSYAPQVGFEKVSDGLISLDDNNWLSQLIKKYRTNKTNVLEYIGRDHINRIELSMPLSLFEELKNDKLFIMKANTLRRLRSNGSTNILDALVHPNIKAFDNDFDKISGVILYKNQLKIENMELFETKYKGYKISRCGKIYCETTLRFLNIHLSKKGYVRVSLKVNNKRLTYIVHRLVAETFIPNPENKPQVNHIDGNKKNNHVENLEWATAQENVRHSWANGLSNNTNASNSLKKKLIDSATGKVYNSISEAAKNIGMKITTLSMMLNGNNKNKTNLKYLKDE